MSLRKQSRCLHFMPADGSDTKASPQSRYKTAPPTSPIRHTDTPAKPTQAKRNSAITLKSADKLCSRSPLKRPREQLTISQIISVGQQWQKEEEEEEGAAKWSLKRDRRLPLCRVVSPSGWPLPVFGQGKSYPL